MVSKESEEQSLWNEYIRRNNDMHTFDLEPIYLGMVVK